MAKKIRAARPADTSAVDVPVVGMREPCPCGSGRRYKACHGRDASVTTIVHRPFEGLASECDIVAMRVLVPAATAPVQLVDGRSITLASVLPMAWPALSREDGSILLGLQVMTGSGDPSRDAAEALERALAAEPGTPIPPVTVPGNGDRLQDLFADEVLEITVHEGFDYWVAGLPGESDAEVKASLAEANSKVIPTVRLEGVDAAYWCSVPGKEHLRWVMPHDEEFLLNAIARLHAAHADSLGEGTRFVGSFRADGLMVPVWDLPTGFGAEQVTEPAIAFAARLADALTDSTPLTSAERAARAGLQNRQITLR